MTDRITTVIAEALRGCGIEDAEKVEVPAILAALKAARIAVVELADEATMEDYGLSVTPVHGSVFGLPIAEEIANEKGMTRTRHRSVTETRNYAAALLAAADAAEASQ